MLASHDSYTYLKSVDKIYNSVTGPWKAQTKSIQEQYNAGVRYFDIRVKREVKAKRNMWRVCHGVADLDYLFTSLKNICAYFETLDGAYWRIILEKGDKEDKKVFREEIEAIKDAYPHFHWCVIKEDWETLFNKGGFTIVDYSCKMNTFGEITGMLKYGVSILKWAHENNPTISPSMILDDKVVYFYDGI